MNCPFCKEGFTKFGNIDRQYWENKCCRAFLAPGQDTDGYSIVTLKEHYNDITDENLSGEILCELIKSIRYIAGELKRRLGAKRIYVASLCDGIEHLHFHLYPRYEWTETDKQNYRNFFIASRGKEAVENYIRQGLIGGFWWLGNFERTSRFKTEQEEIIFSREILRKLKEI